VRAASKDDVVQLTTQAVAVTGAGDAPAGTTWFKIELDKPVAAGEAVQLQILTSFTRRLKPFPEQITQDQVQLVKYSGNALHFSAYPSVKQTTNVKLGTGKTESYSKATAELKGDELESGPHKDVKPFSSDELSVHYENNAAFVTFTSMIKEIEVSHWGNIAVEDHYDLQNTGAVLKGTFSRYEYQRVGGKGGASFRSIQAMLPASASDVYYRDLIGNVSTSHMRETTEDGRHFELEPRFPMFGGWKTDFYMGYNLPASEFLGKDENGRYVLNITFASPFQAATIDQLEVRIILPEFASDVQWATPFDIDSTSWDKRVTYLDVFGRTVLILKKSNLVRHHNQVFQVTYNFSKVYMLQEPILVILGFLAFFLAAMAYTRIELTISAKTVYVVIRSKRAGRVGELINRILTVQPRLVAVYESRNEQRMKEQGDPAFNEIKAVLEELQRHGEVSRIAQRLEEAHLQLKGAAKKLSKGEEKNSSEFKAKYSDRLGEVDALLRELANA
jgi:oligosaccharyltransferase complex subunit alpha (ribophorin I)